MHQEVIGNAAEPSQCLVIVLGDGLLTEVTAGHDQRQSGLPEQEVVEGGIGEHQSKVFQIGCHRRCYRGVGLPFHEDDRTAGRSEQVCLFFVNITVTPGFVEG